jgi:hypothetical protein
MKFQLTFKDPDGVYESLKSELRESVDNIPGLSDNERNDLMESRKEEMTEFIRKWVEYQEYVTIEFDTEANTCVVMEN